MADPPLDALVEARALAWVSAKRRRLFVPRLDELVAPAPGGSEAIARGLARIRSIEMSMDKLATRYGVHKTFHTSMLNACLPHVFGTQIFEQFGERIMAERALVGRHRPCALIQAPRRFGKTVATSSFVAAYLHHVPGASICVFSSGRRASSSFTTKVLGFLEALKANVVISNVETLAVKAPDGDIRRLASLPASPTGSKGQGGGLIILEEAAIIPQRIYAETIAPLLQVAGTAFVGISTPVEDSSFSQLIDEHENDPDSIFSVTKIQLLCPACIAAKQLNCPHMRHLLPPWLRDSDRSEGVRTLMGPTGENDGLFARESLGVSGAFSLNRVFDPDAVDAILKSPATGSFGPSHRLWIAVDPAGGGSSRFALMFARVCCVTREIAVIGASAWRVEDDKDLEPAIQPVLEQVRRAHGIRDTSKSYAVIERNYGGSVVASRIARILRSTATLCPDRNKIGVWTSAQNKERMRIATAELLAAGRIKIHENLISTQNELGLQLARELKAYRYVHKDATDAMGSEPKRRLTGKSGYNQDDLAICLQLLVLWSGVGLTEPGFLLDFSKDEKLKEYFEYRRKQEARAAGGGV